MPIGKEVAAFALQHFRYDGCNDASESHVVVLVGLNDPVKRGTTLPGPFAT